MRLPEAIGDQLWYPHGASGRIDGIMMRRADRRPYKLAIEALQVACADQILEPGYGPEYGVKLLTARAPPGVVHAREHSATMLIQARAANRKTLASGRACL